jgi:hypothetical protein
MCVQVLVVHDLTKREGREREGSDGIFAMHIMAGSNSLPNTSDGRERCTIIMYKNHGMMLRR